MNYLTSDDIFAMHRELVSEFGGSDGIRDRGLFLSFAARPKMEFGGKELYADVFTKTAALLESIAKYHVFVDGNKRTAITTCGRFLFLNGLELTATNDELANFVIDVASGKSEIKDIAEWFKKNTQKI